MHLGAPLYVRRWEAGSPGRVWLNDCDVEAGRAIATMEKSNNVGKEAANWKNLHSGADEDTVGGKAFEVQVILYTILTDNRAAKLNTNSLS